MRTGKDRVRLAAVQRPLSIGGVSVRPGDVVCGDADGVVVVPAERVAEVAGVADGSTTPRPPSSARSRPAPPWLPPDRATAITRCKPPTTFPRR